MTKGEFKDVKGNTVRGNLGWLLKSIQGWSLHYKLTWICIIRQEEKKRSSKTSSYNNRASVLKKSEKHYQLQADIPPNNEG